MTLNQNVLEHVMGDVLRIKPTLDGWCTDEKAKCLVKHLLIDQPAMVVELGVFGGSSFIPMLLALKQNGAGHAHGVDPWTNVAALENMQAETNRDWWGKLDLTAIYNKLLQHLAVHGLQSVCTLHKMKSEEAVSKFEDNSIGLLHIDGNHSEPQSYADATMWLPKLKVGGICCFDDIFWTDGTADVTTRQAVLFLLDHCERIECVGDCMVLRKKAA